MSWFWCSLHLPVVFILHNYILALLQTGLTGNRCKMTAVFLRRWFHLLVIGKWWATTELLLEFGMWFAPGAIYIKIIYYKCL